MEKKKLRTAVVGCSVNWETASMVRTEDNETFTDLRSVETYETSLSKCDEEEQNILYFNDLFYFNIIYPDDSKSDEDNDDDKVDIEHSSGDLSVKPLPDIARRSAMLSKELAERTRELRQMKGEDLEGLDFKELCKLEAIIESRLAAVVERKCIRLSDSVSHCDPELHVSGMVAAIIKWRATAGVNIPLVAFIIARIHQPVAPVPISMRLHETKLKCQFLWCSNVNNAQGRSFDDAEPYFGNSKQTSKARGLPDNNLMKSFAPEKEKASSVRKRPLNKKESAKNEEDIITTETHSSCLIVHETKTQG
ncbi:kinesin-like protein KIN-13B [Tanacetum coccineum]